MDTVQFIQTLFLGSAAVVLTVQFLKSNFVPLQFANKYPRMTTFLASIAATLFAVWQQCQSVVAGCQSLLREPTDYIAAVFGIFFFAVVVYNNVLRDKNKF